jgi:hypothetical protein
MKSCIIYKTDKEYICITPSMTDVWILMDCQPIYKMDLEVDE